MNKPLRNGLLILSFTLLVFYLSPMALANYIADGQCMAPTLPGENRLLVNKVAYALRPPQRGDIIVYQDPNAEDVERIKRIVALPGETVEIKGAVHINGQELAEPYVAQPAKYTMPPVAVLAHHYFVLGDNRNNSFDSHCGFTVPRENIVGKVWLVLWPPSLWGAWEIILAGVLTGLLLLLFIRKSRLRLLLYIGSTGLCLYGLAMLIKTLS